LANDDGRRATATLAGGATAALLLALAALIGYAVWSLRTPASEGLGEAALALLPQSGVESPVTAVLLNFRAYDTLLELTVLFIAFLGIRIGRIPLTLAAVPPSPVLEILNRLLVPFLTLFAAYLLWAGSKHSGGAFQAGAVLAAAGVLIALSGEPPRVAPAAARASIALGPLAFVAAALIGMAAGGTLLEYPAGWAKPIILAMETAAMLSIGATLLALFLGGVPSRAESSAR
jgi:multisubunit Na+/H+ antiporter MnhB subunit